MEGQVAETITDTLDTLEDLHDDPCPEIGNDSTVDSHMVELDLHPSDLPPREIMALSKKMKKLIKDLAEELNHFFQFDNISFYSPYYDGPISMLDLDTLKDIQVADGQISESADYAKDSRGRYILMPHRLPHLLVAIHVQNNHVGLREG